jgi:hypothetical protein
VVVFLGSWGLSVVGLGFQVVVDSVVVVGLGGLGWLVVPG